MDYSSSLPNVLPVALLEYRLQTNDRRFPRSLRMRQLPLLWRRVDRYGALAALVRPTPTPRIAPDPDDDVVIGTALAAKADLVVTGDKPLLSVAEYQGVRIVGVSHALQIIGSA